MYPKKDFVLVMVDDMNCTGQTDSRTKKIEIIIKSTEKYLGSSSWY